MTISDPGLQKRLIWRLQPNQETPVQDVLIVEEPLEIRLCYTDPKSGRVHKTVAITMRTPGEDEALAIGFLFSEGILSSINEVTSIDTRKNNVIRVELSPTASVDTLRLERNFYVTSSCGLCGKASLEALSTSGYDPVTTDNFSLTQSQLLTLGDQLRNSQPRFQATGGNHGVALLDRMGTIIATCEDVGRHNAMDKLIGKQLKANNIPLRDFGILLSGRASYELLQKALSCGCPMIIAVGAPSSLAVELAEEFNLTLVGFLGSQGCNIYSGSHRITQ
jgi:FdhD protein